jgi:acyl-CoA reductase-like NAD-dependent aldehyde dehydrogenase
MTAAEVSGALEEYASVARDAVNMARQFAEVAKSQLRRYKRLLRRAERALDKVRDAIAEFEASDGGDPHVRAGLELLYEVERLLEGVVEG